MAEITGKKVSESATEMMHVPMPDESNAAGNIHGGYLFKHIDDAGGVAAQRHAQHDVVTVSIEYMNYISPVLPGEAMILKSSVHFTGRTSMDVGVRVEVENINSRTTRHAATCFLTYVAVDQNGHPVEVPPLIVTTDEERRRHANAQERRKHRKQLQAALKNEG